jgi:hypothetical protein
MWSEFTINDVASVQRMLEVMRGVWPSHFRHTSYADVQREAADQDYNGIGYFFDGGDATIVHILGYDREFRMWRVHASGFSGNITAETAHELTYSKTRVFLADRLANQACVILPRVPATPIMEGLIRACESDPRVTFRPERDVGTRVMYMLTIRDLPVG